MPIIASNFKTNHTRKSTASFISEVNDYLKNQNVKSEVYVFPTATSLDSFDTVSNFKIGAQNAYATANGSFWAPILKLETVSKESSVVSDFDLMKNAVSASNFKIPLENLGSYLAFATKRAEETGQSVDYLVDSITSVS